MTKNYDCFEKLSKKKRARATAATAEELSQSIQVPSSTHPGTTYPVRANPSLRLFCIGFVLGDVGAALVRNSPKRSKNTFGTYPNKIVCFGKSTKSAKALMIMSDVNAAS